MAIYTEINKTYKKSIFSKNVNKNKYFKTGQDE